MIKPYILIAVSLAMFSFEAAARLDERKPGIYAVVGDESIPLKHSGGLIANTSVLSRIHNVILYDGMSSNVAASDTFVLVVDRDRIVCTSSFVFIKTVDPSQMVILDLCVDAERECRVYDPGERMAGETLEIARPAFEWDRISENSFLIRVFNLVPGEYGIIFRPNRLSPFDYQSIYGFTIEI